MNTCICILNTFVSNWSTSATVDVFNNLKTDILKGYPTKLPDKETLQRFDNIVKPMFLQMQNLTRESHKLVDMRNALLPKLISGELDVSNLDL